MLNKLKSEKNVKDKVSFTKGFHCTARGEIIKIAAIVSENEKILEEINA